jgi:hypothetical protein
MTMQNVTQFLRGLPAPPILPPHAWREVDEHGYPGFRPDVTYVGINSAGYAACFNFADPVKGECWMHTGEEQICLMSDLKWWRVLDRPDGVRDTDGSGNG